MVGFSLIFCERYKAAREQRVGVQRAPPLLLHKRAHLRKVLLRHLLVIPRAKNGLANRQGHLLVCRGQRDNSKG